MNLFIIIGAVGLLLITAGVLLKDRKKEDWLYVAGGLCLEIYSIYLRDNIFIVLQIVFLLSAAYDLFKNKK
jgi:LPXTG-motif cell wall-anchored protein